MGPRGRVACDGCYWGAGFGLLVRVGFNQNFRHPKKGAFCSELQNRIGRECGKFLFVFWKKKEAFIQFWWDWVVEWESDQRKRVGRRNQIFWAHYYYYYYWLVCYHFTCLLDLFQWKASKAKATLPSFMVLSDSDLVPQLPLALPFFSLQKFGGETLNRNRNRNRSIHSVHSFGLILTPVKGREKENYWTYVCVVLHIVALFCLGA